MDIYNYTYYGDYYTESEIIPADNQGGGGGGSSEGGMTEQQVNDAINAALGKIGLVKTDNDSYTLSTDTGGSGSAVIDDIYLNGVERDDNPDTGEKRVKFKMTNGSNFSIPLDVLEDYSLDCQTF